MKEVWRRRRTGRPITPLYGKREDWVGDDLGGIRLLAGEWPASEGRDSVMPPSKPSDPGPRIDSTPERICKMIIGVCDSASASTGIAAATSANRCSIWAQSKPWRPYISLVYMHGSLNSVARIKESTQVRPWHCVSRMLSHSVWVNHGRELSSLPP